MVLTVGHDRQSISAPYLWITKPQGPSFAYACEDSPCQKWYIGFNGPPVLQWEINGLIPRVGQALGTAEPLNKRIEILQGMSGLPHDLDTFRSC